MLSFLKLFVPASIVVAAVFWSGVQAESAEGDALQVKCGRLPADIPGFKYARAIHKPVTYPKVAERDTSEGWVALEHRIDANGQPQNIRVTDAIGPKIFVDHSLKGVAKWRYEPATRHGVAVDQHLHRTVLLFRFPGTQRQADHDQFVTDHNRANRLLKDRKYDEAIAILQRAFLRRTTLYESARGSLVMAVAYLNKNEPDLALFYARHAVIEHAEFLEPELRGPAYIMLVSLEANHGNFREMMCAYKALGDLNLPAVDIEPATKIVDRITSVLRSPEPFAIEGRLVRHPLIGGDAVWTHDLIRSKFSVTELRGDVQRFHLRCVATELEGVVDPEMQWSVPAGGGACNLTVQGAEGATFKVLEE